MITLALFNNKGGVGKTTLAYHLAHMLSRVGYRVLAVDLDPQSNLTAVFLDEDALEILWRERDPMLSADRVLMPLAAELFSLRGLSNLGPVLRGWRSDWQDLVLPRAKDPVSDILPDGLMVPIGYVIMQPAMRLNRPVRAYERWLQRIPVVYAEAVLDEHGFSSDDRSHEIATLRNYQSLMPLAHDARKPMFDLKPNDGAIGATSDFVCRCYEDFHALALDVGTRLMG